MPQYSTFVQYEPAPKGSVSAFPLKRKGGRLGASVVHSKKSVKFETAIREAAKGAVFLQGPVGAELWFYLARPRTVTRKLPSVPPDLDKLSRAVLDGLKHNWEDDARVCDLHAHKRYCNEEYPNPGVHLLVWTLDEVEGK